MIRIPSRAHEARQALQNLGIERVEHRINDREGIDRLTLTMGDGSRVIVEAAEGPRLLLDLLGKDEIASAVPAGPEANGLS